MTMQSLSRYADPDQSPGYQLWRVSNLWQRHLRRALLPFDLTHVQFVVLAVTAWLNTHDKPVTQVQVAHGAQTDEMMTSQALRALETRGLIKRQRHPRDARARDLTVTEAGYALAAQAMKTVEDADSQFFGALGDKEAELSHLLNVVARAELEPPAAEE